MFLEAKFNKFPATRKHGKLSFPRSTPLLRVM